jgi:myosin heavy subunit
LILQSSFKALDEEAKIPKGTSKTWFDKMKNAGSAKYPVLGFPRATKFDIFTVAHYAGIVAYNPISFLEKNVETLNNDVVTVLQNSTVPLVKRLFDAEASPTPSSPRKASMASPPSSSSSSSTSSSSNKSIAFKFQQQLQSLMTMLKATESHFVRCIKSNSRCRPLLFEAGLVQKQLLYSGVFEGWFSCLFVYF